MSLIPRSLAAARANPALVIVVVLGLALAAVPLTNATHFGTGAPDVRIDVRAGPSTVTIHNGTAMTFANVSVPTDPYNFRLAHSTAYELTFVALNVSGSGYGHTGSTNNVELVNASTGAVVAPGTPLTTGPDGSGACAGGVAPGCLRNATFLIQGHFNGPGVYELRSVGSGVIAARILVHPKDDVSVAVSASADPIRYGVSQQTVITVNTSAPGSVLSSNAPGFISGAPTTSPGGSYTFLSTLPMGAGNWTVYAGKDDNPGGSQFIPGTTQSIPERLGNVTFSVRPSLLGVTTLSGSAAVGSTTPLTYRFTYAGNGNPAFVPVNGSYPTDLSGRDAQRFTFEISESSTGARYAYNYTMPPTNGSGATYVPSACFGPGGAMPCSSATPEIAITTTTGNVSIVPRAPWDLAVYLISLDLEAAGGPTTPGDYTAAWGFEPTQSGGQAIFEQSDLSVPTSGTVGRAANVSVMVHNVGDASGAKSVMLLVNGAQRDSVWVALAAHTSTSVQFTFTPTVVGSYQVSTRVENDTLGPLTMVVGAAPAPARVSIGHYNGSVLAPTLAPIRLSNVSDLGSATVTLQMDASVVRVVNVSAGSIATANTTWHWNASSGTLTLLVTTTARPGASGEQVLANIWLEATGLPGTTSALDLEIVEWTDSNGEATAAIAVDGTFRAGLLGDVDGNGVVDLLDVDAINGVVVGTRSIGTIIVANADVNRDGRVSGVDAMMIRQYLAGTRSAL